MAHAQRTPTWRGRPGATFLQTIPTTPRIKMDVQSTTQDASKGSRHLPRDRVLPVGKSTNKPDPELRTEKQTNHTEEHTRRYWPQQIVADHSPLLWCAPSANSLTQPTRTWLKPESNTIGSNTGLTYHYNCTHLPFLPSNCSDHCGWLRPAAQGLEPGRIILAGVGGFRGHHGIRSMAPTVLLPLNPGSWLAGVPGRDSAPYNCFVAEHYLPASGSF